MKCASIRLKYVAAACLTAMIGVAAVTVVGQEITREKAKAEHKDKISRSFCSNNNSFGNDKVSVHDLREMRIPASGLVSVDGGKNGGIGVKGEDRGDVLVRACVQTWGTSEEQARSLANSIRISTSGTIKAESADNPHDWSVSYQILVPRSTNLNLKAHNGGISIGGVDGTAEFETMNGGVSVSNSSGSIKGRTTNGGVNVVLSGSSWKGTGLDVQTSNGGVNLVMPENYAARVETGTVNGGFNSEVKGLQVEKTDGYRGHRATKINTDLNGGGAPIRVITTNGGVRINVLEQ